MSYKVTSDIIPKIDIAIEKSTKKDLGTTHFFFLTFEPQMTYRMLGCAIYIESQRLYEKYT